MAMRKGECGAAVGDSLRCLAAVQTLKHRWPRDTMHPVTFLLSEAKLLAMVLVTQCFLK